MDRLNGNQTTGVSRRGFLKGAGIAALGAASLGVVGCSSEGEPSQKAGGAVSVDFGSTVSWNAEYDVVVVGFGGAGGVASITAADEGAKVLLLEKGALGEEGGNTRYCEQTLLSFKDYDGGIKFLKSMNEGYDTFTDEVADFMVSNSLEMADWLVSMGAPGMTRINETSAPKLGTLDGETGDWLSDDGKEFAEYPERLMPGGSSVEVLKPSPSDENDSKPYWNLIRKNVLDRTDSIDVWLESPAVELIQDPFSKTVLGVKVLRAGEELNIKAKNGVVLSCGSYEANLAKYEEYACYQEIHPYGTLLNTGDGIDMAISVGANLWHMAGMAGPRWAPLYPDSERAMFMGMTQRITKGGSIVYVGENGKRFMAESGWAKHGKLNYGGTFRSQILPKVVYAVFDQTAKDSGGRFEEADESFLITANSLEELAAAIEVDSDALAETVKRYNGYVEAGKDEQFDRHPSTLAKLETGPFYAMRLYGSNTHCFGGPKRNINCEVLDVKDNPIPHLYSAGELGSFWMDVYDGGGCVAETFYTGRAAGKNAAAAKEDVKATDLVPAESSMKEYGNDLAASADADIELGEGEYLGTGQGLHGDIKAKVGIEGGKVVSVEVIEQHETEGITDDVWSKMPDEMVAAGVAEVDTVSGATLASKGLIEAVNDALSQAK